MPGGGGAGGRRRCCRSGGPALASWASIEGEGGPAIMEKGEPLRRLKGKAAVLPGVRSSGAPENGMFIGADFGIKSGLTGSNPEPDSGEGDLWSSSLEAVLSSGLGVSLGEQSFWLPSSGFLLEVDKS